MKHYNVTAAIIMDNNKFLCVQRNISKYDYISKKFEFPGGKIEVNETKEESIKREIQEELNMSISITEEFLSVEHAYPDFSLTLNSFICHADPQSLVLKEHLDYQWLNKNELMNLDWAAADIPIVKKLIESQYG